MLYILYTFNLTQLSSFTYSYFMNHFILSMLIIKLNQLNKLQFSKNNPKFNSRIYLPILFNYYTFFNYTISSDTNYPKLLIPNSINLYLGLFV